MDKKSKILLIVLALVTIFSIGFTFYKTVIRQDFEVVESTEVGVEENETMSEEVSELDLSDGIDKDISSGI